MKMRIRHLSIQNFRGIQKLDWALPKTNLICLIGRGDSTKSSILDAIRFSLFPTWNPSIEEFDFFNGDTSQQIEITVTLGDLPSEFLSDAKYGLRLRGWDAESARVHDEPGTGLETVISARLTIGDNLEPSWDVICERREEGTRFTVADRVKAYATFIGAYTDRHLTWGNNTALSRMTEAENISASLSRRGSCS